METFDFSSKKEPQSLERKQKKQISANFSQMTPEQRQTYWENYKKLVGCGLDMPQNRTETGQGSTI